MIYKKIKKYVPELIGCAYLGVVLAFISAAFMILSYSYIYKILHYLIVRGDASNAVVAAVCASLLLISNFVIYFISLWCTHALAFRMETNLKKEGIKHLMNASFSFYDKNESGRIRKIIDDNTAMTHMSIAHLIPDLTVSVFVPLLGAPLAFYIDWRLGILFITSFITGLLFLVKMMGDKKFLNLYMSAQDKMNSGAVEYVRGIKVLKIFNTDVKSFKEFFNAVTDYSDLALKYSMSCRRWYVLFQVVYNSIFLITLFGNHFGSLTPKELLVKVLFYALFNGLLYVALNKVMYLGMHIYQASSCIEKIEALFDQMSERKTVFGDCDCMDNHSIEFRNVTFGYDDKKVIDHLSFVLEEGKTYALVGASGSGKSTIAKLISGFYALNEGNILIGGRDISEYTEKTMTHNIANVFQDVKLFKKSIYENVRLGRPEATEEEIMYALHQAQCDSILDKFDTREKTVIGSKGVHLSGGESQRIAIARAILKNSGIVILDEASASADPENEYELQQAFANLMKDKTVIMIAHRMSAIKNVDEILVIADGKVIERGNHRSLIGRNSWYKKLQQDYAQANEWKVSI